MESDCNKDELMQKRAALKVILDKKKKKKTSCNSIDMVPRKENENYFVSSYEQKRLWFLHKLNPDSIMYNLYFGFRILGKLNVNSFQKALDKIAIEHESLRTKFQYINEEVMQVIEPTFNGQVNIINLTNVNGENVEDKVREIAQKEADKPFDLERGPLVRFTLIEIGEDERLFITVIHHIIFDGWSIGVFYHELTENYNQLCLGMDCPQKINRVQYGDYAEWQKKFFSQNRMEKQFDYWEDKLKNIDHNIEFPTDRKRPSVLTGNGDVVTFELNKSIVERLKKYATKNNCTISVVLLSVYKCLIYKYTMQSNITVGTAVANRKVNGTEDVIGFFVNTLVLVTEIDGNMKFSEVIDKVRNTTLEAYDNQDVPFEQLVEMFKPSRDTSRNPFFQLVFNYLNTPKSKFELQNLKVEDYPLGSRKSLVDVSLQIEESEGRIFGFFGYNSDLFFSETIQNICDQFQLLLEEVLKDKNNRINEISTLSEQERNLILNKFNDTYVEYPSEKTVVDLFEEQVEKTPNNIAVVYKDKNLSYNELNEKANLLALKLRELGVKPDDFVAIIAQKSLEMIIGILGIIKAGGAYVPVDPGYPEDRVSYILADCKPKAIVTYESEIKSEGIPIIDLKDVNIFKGESKNLKKVNKPRDLLYVIYTSGTTGKPKGVMIENTGVSNLREYFIRNHKITEKDRILQFASFAFDAMVSELSMSLLTGASLYVITKEVQMDSKLFEDFVETNEITMAILPPQYLGQLKLKGIKHVISAGSETNMQIVKENSRHSRYSNDYGPTEVTVCATHWLYEDKVKIPDRIPIGKPIENKQIYILNGMSLCGIGMPGELCIAGVGLARGYLNNLQLTAEKFINNPYGEGRLYRTGDLARWLTDGNIEYLGRIDEQVKIRGFRIELGEIENIIRKIDYIKDVVVVAREDLSEDKAIYAYIISDIQVDWKKIREKIRKELPDYMVPSYFIQIEEVPLTSNGKIDKKALPKKIGNTSIDYTAPRNELERKLVQVWCEVLGIKEIGVHDNFFELGGDSIKAIKLVSKLVLDYTVSANDIFENQTIAEFSQKLSKDSMLDKIKALTKIRTEMAIDLDERTNNIDNYAKKNISEELKNKFQSYIEGIQIYRKVDLHKTKNYEKVMLCGATGYLGIYVLKELLENSFSKIVLIIRGKDINDSINKLIRKFEFYFDKELYNRYNERLIILNGDISKENLGLSNDIYNNISNDVQCIINCAANVKHYGKYDELYSVNVTGTKNLLEFSINKNTKDYNHVSTTSVGYGKIKNRRKVLFTEYDYDIGQQNDNYYIQTKQLAENLVLEAKTKGVKCNIMRVGNLVFNSEDGKFQENIDENNFYKLIKSYISLSAFPIGDDMNFEFSFVDYVSKAIVLLYDKQELVNETYHIFNDNYVNTSEFGKLVGKFVSKVKLIEEKVFLDYLLNEYNNNPDNDYVINLIFSYSEGLNSDLIEFMLKSDKTNLILEKLGFYWPILKEKHVEKMIDYCFKVKYLE